MSTEPFVTPPTDKVSASQVQATARAILLAHPDLSADEANTRAASLVSRGAITIDGTTGEIGVKSKGIDLVRQVAPGLLGEKAAPQKIDAPTKAGRAMQREKLYAQRQADAAAERSRRSTLSAAMKAINAKMADEIAADPTLAKSPDRRAELRERFTRDVYASANIPIPGSLDDNGVRS